MTHDPDFKQVSEIIYRVHINEIYIIDRKIFGQSNGERKCFSN